MESNALQSSKIDYAKRASLYPSYRLHRVPPQYSVSDLGLSSAGGVESIFELPTKVYNLSRSILSFTLYIEQGAAGSINFITRDCLNMIDQIQCYTKSGKYLCDLRYTGNYTKMVWKPETKFDEFKTFDDHYLGATPNTVTGAGKIFQPCNVNTQLQTSFTAMNTVSMQGAAALTGAQVIAAYGFPSVYSKRYNDNLIANGTGSSLVTVEYSEPLYVECGAASGAGDAGDIYLKVQLPLGMIYNTIFSLDKDLYLGEIVYLRVVWSSFAKLCWSTTPTANAPPAPGATPVTVADNSANTIDNLYLYLAEENNNNISNQIMAKVASGGMSILVPYITANKQNISSTLQTVSLRFNRGHGKTLQKIYHSIFNNAESVNTAYDIDNRADAKCISFYTMLNTDRRQEFDVDTSNYEDYMLLKERLKGSVIQSAEMYQYNWVFIDDFTEPLAPDEKSPLEDNKLSGLDLTVEQRWDFYGTTPNQAQNHYSFAVTQKELTVSPAGIDFL